MMDMFDLAGALFGGSRTAPQGRSVTATGAASSADGVARIKLDADVTPAEGVDEDSDQTIIDLPTSPDVADGDEVIVTLVGDGPLKSPVVMANPGSGDRQNERIHAIEADYVKATELEADVADIGFLKADSATITALQADTAKVHDLTAAQLTAATGYVGELQAGSVTAQDIVAGKATVGELVADHVSVSDFEVEQANIDNLQAATADIATIRANSAKVQNLTAAQLEADHATIGTLDTTYMHANMSNSDVAWIENGTIKDGAIVSAMINDVSANKLTAGTINGSVINVTNLNADNITTGTINGQRIGEGSLSLDKLSEDVYTEAEVNNIVDGLNDRIDGAIETFTGTAVPTLNNQPASSWNTTKLRDEHVGDVYYVVNSQSQQNGYCYRFTKSGSTYSWQLIKDSDVTAALSRLTTAEGKITTFDSDISTLKTTTGTLTTKTESLETRMSDAESDILDKVDTTTFNEVSDTVDSHSQSISQMSTTLSNKADSSTVTAVTNRVSKNEQDISGINTTIGELQDTVETKADGSTVSTISNKLNTVSDTVDGHTQTLTSVQNTLSSKADSSTVSTLTTKVNTIEDTVDGHTQTISGQSTILSNNGLTSSTNITNRVSSVEQDLSGYKTTVSETYATKTAVNGKADASDVTALAGRVTTAESNITQNANNIALKVSESDVTGNYLVGKINLDSTTASIAAEHINLQGAVTISDLSSDAQSATLNSNISVGGRNLVSSLAANWRRTTVSESSSVGTSWKYMSRTASTTRISAIDLIPVDGDFVTVSLASGYDAFLTFFDANGYMKKYLTWSNQRTVDLSDYSGVTAVGLTVRKSDNSTITLDDVALAKIKLEKGNVATDWTAAPEDVDAAITNAAKTATSYVTEITGQNGIMVHPSGNQNTGVRVTSDVDILRSGTSVANYGATARIGTLAGKHVTIDSDSVDLMDGSASLATFGANDTHIGMSGTGNVYMANDKFLLSASTSEGEYETGKTYTQVESGFKAQNLGENYRVYSGLNSKLNYNDDGGYTASDTYIDAWVEDSTGHELRRAYVELWADPLYQTAVRLSGDSVELLGDEVTYVSPYNSYPLQLGKPVVRSASKSMTITSTNTWIDGPSVYLDQGQWLVVGVACFNSGSSSGNRKLRAQLRLDSSVYVEGTEVCVATNEYGRIQATAVMTVGSSEGLDATLVLSSSMTFTSATTSYVTAVQLA